MSVQFMQSATLLQCMGVALRSLILQSLILWGVASILMPHIVKVCWTMLWCETVKWWKGYRYGTFEKEVIFGFCRGAFVHYFRPWLGTKILRVLTELVWSSDCHQSVNECSIALRMCITSRLWAKNALTKDHLDMFKCLTRGHLIFDKFLL